MALAHCSMGHYYDSSRYDVCPYCLTNAKKSDAGAAEKDDVTTDYRPENDADGVTIGYRIFEHDVLAKPTVGWLVCVKGDQCGRDWRLHEGRNDIAASMDAEVNLGDSMAKGERWGSVVYDGKHEQFLLIPGNTSLIYHNGLLLAQPVQLADGDEIGVEENILCFQKFCGKYHL